VMVAKIEFFLLRMFLTLVHYCISEVVVDDEYTKVCGRR
jgi:hypothetical protein